MNHNIIRMHVTFAVPVLDFIHKNDVAASKCYTVFLKCNTSMKLNLVLTDIVNDDNNFNTYDLDNSYKKIDSDYCYLRCHVSSVK